MAFFLIITERMTNLPMLIDTTKTERYIERKIRTLTLTTDEYAKNATILDKRPQFVLWNKEENKA
jgi:hypothetical protein